MDGQVAVLAAVEKDLMPNICTGMLRLKANMRSIAPRISAVENQRDSLGEKHCTLTRPGLD